MDTERGTGWLRRVALGAVLVALPAGGVAAWRVAPVSAQVVEVQRGTVKREAVGVGTVESEAVVTLAFTVPGRVVRVLGEEGHAVAAGDVLAELDVDVLARQLAVAEAGVGAAAAAVERAQAEVARAEAGRVAAELDLARTTQLVSTGVLQQSLLETARERGSRTAAELDVARASLLQARRAHGVARATASAQSRVVTEGILRSPVDGVITRRHREPGDVVGTGAPVLQVASTRKLWARVWVDETSLARMEVGAPARVVLRGEEERPLRARVDRVSTEADRQTHEVLVDLELLERPARMVLGQRAEASILLEKREDVAMAPRTACDTAASRCWMEREGRISEVEVAFGLAGGDRVEIVRGLVPGDRLVDRAALGVDPPVGRRVGGRTP